MGMPAACQIQIGEEDTGMLLPSALAPHFLHKYPSPTRESRRGLWHTAGVRLPPNFTLGGYLCFLLFACLFSGGSSAALSLSWFLTDLAGFYCSLPGCWQNNKVWDL